MILSHLQLNQLSLLALEAVKLAADYIKGFDRTQLKTDLKSDDGSLSSQVVTQVDLACQAIILEHLRTSCEEYDIALLSEENCSETSINQHPRFLKEYFWCIDPLDGTLPFIEGRDGYAVSIALISKNGKAIIGAIALPASNVDYHTQINEQGLTELYKNGNQVSPHSAGVQQTLNVYCDQSFITTTHYKWLIHQLSGCLGSLNFTSLKVISGNGAVVNALSVLENPPACYIKMPKKQQGGGAIWDFSSTTCMSQASHSWISDIHGMPLMLNQADSYYMNKNGIIYASDAMLAKEIIRICNDSQ